MRTVTIELSYNSAVHVTLIDNELPEANCAREIVVSTMAEAMVEVMEFLAPNQLHSVSAYLELKAEQDEKTSFQAVYGG